MSPFWFLQDLFFFSFFILIFIQCSFLLKCSRSVSKFVQCTFFGYYYNYNKMIMIMVMFITFIKIYCIEFSMFPVSSLSHCFSIIHLNTKKTEEKKITRNSRSKFGYWKFRLKRPQFQIKSIHHHYKIISSDKIILLCSLIMLFTYKGGLLSQHFL